MRHPDEGWRVACFLRGTHRLVGATHVAVRTGVLQTCRGAKNSGQPALGRSKPESGCPLVGDAHRTQQVSRHASGSIDMHASLTQAHAHTVT